MFHWVGDVHTLNFSGGITNFGFVSYPCGFAYDNGTINVLVRDGVLGRLSICTEISKGRWTKRTLSGNGDIVYEVTVTTIACILIKQTTFYMCQQLEKGLQRFQRKEIQSGLHIRMILEIVGKQLMVALLHLQN